MKERANRGMEGLGAFQEVRLVLMEVREMRSTAYLMVATMLLMSILSSAHSWSSVFGPISDTGRSPELRMDMNVSNRAATTFLGESPGDASGMSAAGVGDVNGDGLSDLLIGAPNNAENGGAAGQAYLILGNYSGWDKDTSLSGSDASFLGNAIGMLGDKVCGAGDVNGDGYDDFLTGAYSDMEGGNQAGKVYMHFGKATGWKMDSYDSSANVRIRGVALHEMVGISMAGGGDVNGDGYDDILIGSENAGNGRAYLFFGRPSGWQSNMLITDADASFVPENSGDFVGRAVSIAGDLNGDGFDDIALGANGNDEAANHAGQTYIVFGRSVGWPPQFQLSDANASFRGEDEMDNSGWSVAGAGDVNNDGYDDLLIGANTDSDGGNHAGQTYLVLGKGAGWYMDADLESSNASFIGENEDDESGSSVSSAGDVNGDGYDDILIGAERNSENGVEAGQVYIIYGKASGWTMDMPLSGSDASLLGETAGDSCGHSLAPAGDANGDGSDDILIGAFRNDQNGNIAGKTYVISGTSYREPYEIFSIKATDGMGVPVDKVDKGGTVYIEMTGRDSNATLVNRARVNITFTRTLPHQITISLVETGKDTGTYRSKFTIQGWREYFEGMTLNAYIDPSKYTRLAVDYPYRPTSVVSIGVYESPSGSTAVDKLDIGQTGHFRCVGLDSNLLSVDKAFVNLTSDKDAAFRRMVVLTETGPDTGTFTAAFTVPGTMRYYENVTLTSSETPARTSKFMVHTPVQVRAKGPYLIAQEDQEYRAGFYNFGYNEAIWTVSTNAYWLDWDDEDKEYHGTPRNNDVSRNAWEVLVEIEDEFEHKSTLEYLIEVVNTPPRIVTEPVREWTEGIEYRVDFDCDDDAQGMMTWTIETDSPFLTINLETGAMRGTPIEGDAGVYNVTVRVDDGHQGSGELSYDLTVVKRNDRPQITTVDITQVEQDTPFRRDYDVYDPDEGDTQFWELRTDADWLSMENDTGMLYGTPDGYDVGEWLVNITVTDSGNLSDSREFGLTVLNVKDRPRFDDVPSDEVLLHGTEYSFDVNASDPDYGTVLYYSVLTDPASDMTIDQVTGSIEWKASYRSMPLNDQGMEITLRVSDGELSSAHMYHIKVLPTEPPVVELVSPPKGARTLSNITVLEWTGSDPENETVTYTLYIAESESIVTARRPEHVERSGIEGERYELENLVEGMTYFWMVVPDDGCSEGVCMNGVFSFRVNRRPLLAPVETQRATEGAEFRLRLKGSDGDGDDTLVYEVEQGPSGLKVDPETGVVVWTPKASHIGTHSVTVKVTDGVEGVERTFSIEVSKGRSSVTGLIVGVVIGALVLIIIALFLYILVFRKRPSEGEGEAGEGKVAEEGLEDVEGHVPEYEGEQTEGGRSGGAMGTVHLTAGESHSPDRTRRKLGYEELYGRPAPDKSEELTAVQLKEELEKLTEEMMKIGTEE